MPETTGLRWVGERLECAACHEVEMWCQCEPYPFSDDAKREAALNAMVRETWELGLYD